MLWSSLNGVAMGLIEFVWDRNFQMYGNDFVLMVGMGLGKCTRMLKSTKSSSKFAFNDVFIRVSDKVN